jgi:hypothetical protein
MRNHTTSAARVTMALAVIGLVVGGVGLGPSTAWAQSDWAGCSDRTLKGNYAFAIDGAILAGPATLLIKGLAMTHFDGDGHLSQVDFVTVNGVADTPGEWNPGTGSYEVAQDCTGEASIAREVGPPLHLRLVVGNKGALVHTLVDIEGAGVATIGTGTRVN